MLFFNTTFPPITFPPFFPIYIALNKMNVHTILTISQAYFNFKQ